LFIPAEKNQQWIGELTDKLDKRRPQVLIDVTLVEVTRTDSFEYDLDIVANASSAAAGNIIINPLEDITINPILEGGFNMRDTDGNPTGQSKVFYNDNKIQALLTAMRQKNYGRVLAKPKILVDDGQEGQIITKDITSYVHETVQVPPTGAPITTRDFAPVEASIELLITPHISEGDLLRLDVDLSRGDFGSRPILGAPPDITSSKVTTTVFVPDQSTVILGGLVKLNQTKAGTKIPFLGDLPIIGSLFRTIGNSDVEKKLYVFLKANIIRPYNESKLEDLREISDKYRDAFEKSESEFQGTENWPGLKPVPMPPKQVLEGYE
jgi:general secretion pathway protein D